MAERAKRRIGFLLEDVSLELDRLALAIYDLNRIDRIADLVWNASQAIWRRGQELAERPMPPSQGNG